MKRTHHCNELRPNHVGQTVTLAGWVHSKRDLGGVVLLDIRDREGRTQAGVDPQDVPADLGERAAGPHAEREVALTGRVRPRPEGTANPKTSPGQVQDDLDAVAPVFYNVFRWYQPRNGRYLTPDPM